MIVISLIVGVVAVVLAQRLIQQKSDASISQVVVAKTDIDMGTRLTPEM